MSNGTTAVGYSTRVQVDGHVLGNVFCLYEESSSRQVYVSIWKVPKVYTRPCMTKTMQTLIRHRAGDRRHSIEMTRPGLGRSGPLHPEVAPQSW